MSFFEFGERVDALSKGALEKCKPIFEKIDDVAEYNQQCVLKAFIDNGVSDSHFAGSTGYGYGDRGRDVCDAVTAQIFGVEDALIRHSFASGTTTICTMLFGVLRPSDRVLCVTGMPYDTLQSVIGIDGDGMGSLKDFGIEFDILNLKADGSVDLDGMKKRLESEKYAAVYIQRSKGYALRQTLTNEIIKQIVDIAHGFDGVFTVLDNCYGEFTEMSSVGDTGIDVFAGSLIKNPGGGIAKCGGYIAGKSKFVELCSYRMTCPGIGREVGATLGNTRDILMGLFNAPHVTGEATKTAVFAAALFEEMGYKTSPRYCESRADIIQSIELSTPEKLIAFCKGLQSGSAVDSFATPEPAPMPGYDSDVIMAAGAFTNGSSIELSADGPLREPYAVWLQGGLNFHSGKVGIMLAAKCVMDCEK